jgi:ABC-type branched-subunit amino acid transport system substrate-binding protein
MPETPGRTISINYTGALVSVSGLLWGILPSSDSILPAAPISGRLGIIIISISFSGGITKAHRGDYHIWAGVFCRMLPVPADLFAAI